MGFLGSVLQKHILPQSAITIAIAKYMKMDKILFQVCIAFRNKCAIITLFTH